jgi:hypothetical protein
VSRFLRRNNAKLRQHFWISDFWKQINKHENYMMFFRRVVKVGTNDKSVKVYTYLLNPKNYLILKKIKQKFQKIPQFFSSPNSSIHQTFSQTLSNKTCPIYNFNAYWHHKSPRKLLITCKFLYMFNKKAQKFHIFVNLDLHLINVLYPGSD